jgi:hypothetical protein
MIQLSLRQRRYRWRVKKVDEDADFARGVHNSLEERQPRKLGQASGSGSSGTKGVEVGSETAAAPANDKEPNDFASALRRALDVPGSSNLPVIEEEQERYEKELDNMADEGEPVINNRESDEDSDDELDGSAGNRAPVVKLPPGMPRTFPKD